jgi:hypothetical protein
MSNRPFRERRVRIEFLDHSQSGLGHPDANKVSDVLRFLQNKEFIIYADWDCPNCPDPEDCSTCPPEVITVVLGN